MGRQCLLPLELADCLTDSPHFRQNLHAYEKELENTSASIKTLVKDIKEVLDAAKQLSRCQRAFANSLDKFQFDCIGGSQTDDEIVIAGSLKQFAALIHLIEEERQRMLDHGHKHILGALESFRRTHIGAAKEGRKKFEKQTQKFCASLERHLNLSTKKMEDQAMKEADASLEMEQRFFVQASLDYVCMLQEVQERKKFEFVETTAPKPAHVRCFGCMYGWLTFYHQGHEVANDYKGQMTDLQMRLQKRGGGAEGNKMMVDVRQTKSQDAGTRQGYLYLMEKKAFGTTWTKHYCMYDKKTKNLSLIPYNQLTGKLSSTDQMVVKSCVRRMSETIDRRFCFDVTAEERDGQVYTLQALSEHDRRLWLDAMDGKEPTYSNYGIDQRTEETALEDSGFHFITTCIAQLEGRGLEEQGLYRVVGVNSKVTKLVQLGLSRHKLDKLPLDNVVEWETKTLTSAIKTFLRSLPEPLMTFRLHHEFINAAKTDNKEVRVAEIHKLVRKLPKVNYRMLKILMQHAQNVSRKSDKNLMSVSNLGVCFGPTLLRPEEETMAAIIDIKFCNAVVEILIGHFDTIFSGGPVASTGDSNGQLHYSNGPVSAGPPPAKPGIISAMAQPVQVTAYEAEQPARSARLPAGVARRHYPPPYAHPPPPVY
ncbi:rho GTPase-activating protein 26-like, partial [Pollicipes pollicipes]|uniref:rho GTPase-activating protein 26-like n=1 Tax=Pollicipes pollicipes TaxID=41117 RepID=UPI001884F770